MNTNYISKVIGPFVADNRLTYDDFEKIFGLLPLKEQYPICYAIQDDLHIELVDEITSEPAEPATEVKDAHEIKVPNKFLVRLIQSGDVQARQDLCVKNSGLVAKFAKKYQAQYPSKLELDDLMQEGFAGLLKAAAKFDFAKDTAFTTYAVPWIRQSITRAIYDTGLTIRLPVHIIEKIIKASKIDRELQRRDLPVRRRLELIAEQMETKFEDVRQLFEWREIYFRMKSLDSPITEESDTPLADLISDDGETLDDTVSVVLLREQLDEILSTLTQRERTVLSLRYGLLDGHERTLETVGKIFHVTRERIRQIEAKALRKLRHPARSKKLRDFL